MLCAAHIDFTYETARFQGFEMGSRVVVTGTVGKLRGVTYVHMKLVKYAGGIPYSAADLALPDRFGGW